MKIKVSRLHAHHILMQECYYKIREKICLLILDKIDQMVYSFISHYNKELGTPLVVQWLRIHLPTQGTQVQALVREDP